MVHLPLCHAASFRLSVPIPVPQRPLSSSFSVLNRPLPNYPGHVPLTRLERAVALVGSGIGAFMNPQRGDLVALFSEVSSPSSVLSRLRDSMLLHPTGRRILHDHPLITSTSLNLLRLRLLPPTTVGATYAAFLAREHISPDTRLPILHVNNPELAYVLLRYRQCHDFYHAVLTGLPTLREGEVALKVFEFANTGLPMAGLAAMTAVTMGSAARRRFLRIYGPWAIRNGTRAGQILNVYWEEELDRDVEEVRRSLGIEKAPDVREMRRREKAERVRMKREKATAAAEAATESVG